MIGDGNPVRWGLPTAIDLVEPLPAVVAQLERGVARGVPIVVQAPVGSGKSALVARWVADHPDRHAVWLTVNGMLSGWSDVRHMLVTAIGIPPLAPGTQVPWVTVLERLQLLTRQLVVVIDGADLLSADLDITQVLGAVEQLPRVTVVLISRRRPARLNDIGATRLELVTGRAMAWDSAIARKVLAGVGAEVPAPILAAILVHTEGRARAVLDCAARWREESVVETVGKRRSPDRLAADWHLERVEEAAGPAGVRLVLALASLLDTPESLLVRLLDLLAGIDRDGVQHLIEEGHVVERASVFSGHAVYTVSPAVITELSLIARDREADLVRSAHEIASGLPEADGLAPFHRAMSGDHESAAALVLSRWRGTPAMGGVVFAAAIRAIPLDLIAQDPVLAALRIAFEKVNPGALNLADRRHHEAILSLGQASLGALRVADRLLIEGAAVEVLVQRGRFKQAIVRAAGLAEECITRLPELDTAARRALAYLLVSLAEVYLVTLDLGRALGMATVVIDLDGRDRWAISKYRSYAVTALCHLFAGDRERMRHALVQADLYFAMAGFEPSAVQSFQFLTEFGDARLRGDAGTAEELAGWFTAFSPGSPSGDMTGEVLGVWVASLRGDFDAAAAELDRVIGSPAFPRQTPTTRAIALGVSAELQLAARRPGAALERLGTLSSPPRHALCFDALRASAHLALGNPARALDVTEECVRMGTAHETLSLGQVLAVRASAHLSARRIEAARTDILRAIHLVSPEWRRATLRILPPAAVGPLHALLAQEPVETEAVTLLAELAEAAGGGQFSAGGLSPKEARLLELLKDDLSLAEIAGQLFVSINTIKTQSRSLYRKLGVSSRREAVDLAFAQGVRESHSERLSTRDAKRRD